jgi:hypothetical protein
VVGLIGDPDTVPVDVRSREEFRGGAVLAFGRD